MAYTSPLDVATDLGRPLTDSEQAQVSAWIDRVEARILQRIPDLADRALDPAYLDRLTGIVVDVVVRKLRNPEGMRSERIDDYYYDRGSQSADLTLSDLEWGELLPESASGAFSTRPNFVPDRACWPW